MAGPLHDAPPQALVAPEAGPVSGASRRLRALAALSGSLTDALSPKAAADLVEQQALSALGATSAVVVTLGPFPPPILVAGAKPPPRTEQAAAASLHVVHAIGAPAEVYAALEEVPLEAPVPFAEVARTGQPRFLPDEDALRSYAEWGRAMLVAGARSAAVVPVWANGELRGVLGLAWNEPRVFDEDETAFVLTLGVMCAQAIMRAHLRDAERKAREGAERANQSKANFVAAISHELRTPMNAILGYTALIDEEIYGPVTTSQRDGLGRVRVAGQHLLGLIEELLGYARIEAGEAVVRAVPVELLSVVEQSLVLVRPIAGSKGLRISVEAPVTPVMLHTDPSKLRQILVNLLANAVKFTEQGEVRVLVCLVGEGIAGDAENWGEGVTITISDTGRGIADDEQGHVFDPFWQADPHARTSGGSSGLGLSVARQLARLLGGDVRLVESAPGVGSSLVVTLPRVAPVTVTVVPDVESVGLAH
jgi:signal transduction histidine kinase